MKIQREGNGKHTKPIITEEVVKYICDKYLEGWSITKIKKQLECSPELVSKILKSNDVKIKSDREQAKKYYCNEDYFEVIDSEEKAYWLGFMFADGFITNKSKHSNYKVGLTLSSVDKSHIEKFNRCINSTYPINTYEIKQNTGAFNTKPYSRLIISSEKMALDLIDKGCVLNKTNVLIFPSSDKLPKNLIPHFIRGYNDGDGSITCSKNKKNSIDYKIKITSTKEFLEVIKKYYDVPHLKLEKRHKNNSNNYTLTLGGNIKVEKILNNLYSNATIYLERKYDKYIEFKKYRNS